MTDPVKVRIAINPFPGSTEDIVARGAGSKTVCGVVGCQAQVTFWCSTSQEYVCWLHGQLTLRGEWKLWDPLTIEGVAVIQGKDVDVVEVSRIFCGKCNAGPSGYAGRCANCGEKF